MFPLGDIRIFYPSSILWDSDLSSIRVEWFLLTPTLGSCKYFLPESPSLQMIACCTRRFRRYSPRFSRDPCAHRLYNPLPPTYPYSYLHSQLLLLLQDALNCSLLFWKSFKLTALQFFTTWIPLLKIPRTYWVSVHPQLFVCFIRYSEILFDLLSILFELLLCKYLYAYIMDAPISLAIFTSIFWHCHFDPIDSTCVRMHTIINRPF